VSKQIDKNGIYMRVIPVITAMSLALAVGLFLLHGKREMPAEPAPAENPVEEKAWSSRGPETDPVRYIHRSEVISGLKQEIDILEIDPGSPAVKIKPALSYDMIYGYEQLSKMAERANAFAAVNGGFFRDYGLPSGMVVIDGELISKATGNYPVLIIRDGKAELKEINSRLSIVKAGGSYRHNDSRGTGSEAGTPAGSSTDGSGHMVISVANINFPAAGNQTIVYTPVYGRTNRADKRNITATVEGGIVTGIAEYEEEVPIPKDGMLISFFDVARYSAEELPIKAGDAVELIHEPDMTGDVQAYECGCWLVRDGVTVVKDSDPWVGVLTNRDPRTAVGIKEDGTVILLTVDGRQPGYSAGFTGKELAAYLISCGAVDAAMLDGGASTAMIVDGKLVNRPSYKGQEREIAGAILVIRDR